MSVKKRRENQQERKTMLPKTLIFVVLAVLVLIVATVSAMFLFSPQSSEVIFSRNAAIIDQLSMEYPNQSFVGNVTKILEDYNFNVTYHNQTLNVEFFRKLATYNYGIIILRVHSALRNDSSTVDLFTSEPYKENLHVQEQQGGLLVEGVLNYSVSPKEYFAITYKFVENLEGQFPKSIIIAMGCWSLKQGAEQMAKAFIEKGAVAYIGWTGLVDVSHTDQETIKLIKNLAENKTIYEAVSSTSADPIFVGSKMSYHPLTARDIKLSNLIKEAESKIAYNQLLNYFGYILVLRIKIFSSVYN